MRVRVSAPETARHNHRDFHQRNASRSLQVQEGNMKKYCNFCGAPLKDSAKECEQCGWDRSQDGPPSSDPADTKARIGVAAGLLVAYAAMVLLLQGDPGAGAATHGRLYVM